MKVKDPRVSRLYEYLAGVTQTAYQDGYLLATEVLSKSSFCRNILQPFLADVPAPRVTRYKIFLKILLYYLKSFVRYLVQLSRVLIHNFSKQKCNLDPETENLFLLDIVFVLKNIVSDGNYKNEHFPGLEENLKRRGITYAYTTQFIEARNPLELFLAFRIIKKNNLPLLTEFQVLKFEDYFQAFKFLLTYPFHVRRLIQRLGTKPEDSFMKFALWNTLDGPALFNYFQFLYGCRLSLLTVPKTQCVSWYENRAREKCFYKGLRWVLGKVVILGAQMYVWPSNLGSISPDEDEKDFGIIPDKILVNGPYYLPRQSLLNYHIGPSLSSKRIFQIRPNPSASNNILVLVPPFKPEMKYLLELIKELDLKQPMFIKFPPRVNWRKFSKKLRKDIQVVEGDVFDFLTFSRMVVGMASGTLVEAASLGIPAISIEIDSPGPSEFGQSFMPEFGKGILWDSARTAVETAALVEAFNKRIDSEYEKIAELGEQYKRLFFCQPSNQKIIEAFGLDEKRPGK